MDTDKLNFDISAEIIFTLGEQLVSDELQAIAELIKNSYDAGAEKVEINVYTDTKNFKKPAEPWIDTQPKSYLIIQDFGSGGMTSEQIRDQWLVLAHSVKRAVKTAYKAKADEVDNDSPLPLGDKGIGRLGAQKIGSTIQVRTRPKGSKVEYHVSIKWADFREAKKLTDVKIPLITRTATMPEGTQILIGDLVDPNFWVNPEATREASLSSLLSTVLNPYKDTGARLTVSVNDEIIDLYEEIQSIVNYSDLEYIIDYSNGQLRFDCKIRLAYLKRGKGTTDKTSDAVDFDRFIESDNGEEFFRFLDKQKPLSHVKNVVRSPDPRYFLEYSYTVEAASVPHVRLKDKKFIDPGPFEGALYSITIRDIPYKNPRKDRQSNVIARKEVSDTLNALQGVRVYRNGFNVRTGDDWLSIAKTVSSGTSYQGLRPKNTIGYISIDSRKNINLQEVTSREGFIKNEYYANFAQILSDSIQKLNAVLKQLSQRARAFIALKNQEIGAVESTTTTDVSTEITNKTKSIENASKGIAESMDNAYTATQRISGLIDEESKKLFSTGIDSGQLLEANKTIIKVIEDAKASAEKTRREAESIRARSRILNIKYTELEEHLQEMYEVIGVGLMAEFVSHEMGRAVKHILTQTRSVKSYLSQSDSSDIRLDRYVKMVESYMSSVGKQISHIDPAMKYYRERKSELKVSKLVDASTSYFREGEGKASFNIQNKDDFAVSVSEGRYYQILDNLIINSIYWLNRSLERGYIETPEITIEIKEPYIYVSDNGEGIDPRVQETLFDPFITTKGKSEGRGLGLYITQQLLESDGASISLLTDKNKIGRLYKFALDLSAVRVGA